MKMLIFYLGVALLHVGITAQAVPDMGVLIGGLDSHDFSHYLGVDVYTTHLSDDEKKCENTGKEPTIPDFPFGITKHNAIYLPNHGIYVCGWVGRLGQQSSECWNYNPEVSGAWTKLEATLGGVDHAAIIAGSSDSISNPNAFWIIGGENYENQVLNETLFLDVSSSDADFKAGVKLPISVYGHCALNVKIPLVEDAKEDDDYFQAGIIMGGYEGRDRFRIDSTDKTFSFCKRHENINETVCSQENANDYGWSAMPKIQSIKYGKKGFGHTYCAQFTDETLCDGVCLIAHGTWNENAEYFPYERCAKSGQECEGWKDEINGKKLAVNNEADHALGGMTTLNNVPTLFLPLYDSNGPNGYQEKWTDVFEFKDYEWKLLEKLDNSRGSFVPISVPKDFLCIEPPPPTTTTTTTTTTAPNTATTNDNKPTNSAVTTAPNTATTNDNKPTNSAVAGQRCEISWIFFVAYVLNRFFVFFT